MDPDLRQYSDFDNIENMEQRIGSISSAAVQPASPKSAFNITRRRLEDQTSRIIAAEGTRLLWSIPSLQSGTLVSIRRRIGP